MVIKWKEIDRKRWELWVTTFLVIITYTIVVITISLYTENKNFLLIFLAIFSVLFCSYMLEKEKRLQELSYNLRMKEFQSLEQEAKITLLNTKLKELTALHKAVESVNLEKNTQKSLDTILQSALDLFEIKRGSIMLLDKSTNRLVIVSSRGLKKELIKNSRPRIGEGVSGWVLKTGKPLLLSDRIRDGQFRNFIEKEVEIVSAICVPLKIKGRLIGVLNCSSIDRNEKVFTEYDLKMLSIFAKYVSIVLENAQLRGLKRAV